MKKATPITARVAAPMDAARIYRLSEPWADHNYAMLFVHPITKGCLLVPLHETDPIRYMRWHQALHTRILRLLGKPGPFDDMPFLTLCPAAHAVMYRAHFTEEQALAAFGYVLDGTDPLDAEPTPAEQTLEDFLDEVMNGWTPPNDLN